MDLANIGDRRIDESYFKTPQGISYFEPRVLWGAQALSPGTPGSPAQASASAYPSSRILSGDFKSRSKHDVFLTHVLVDGIGYLFDSVGIGDDDTTNYAGTRDFALQHVSVQIDAPYRANFLRNPIDLSAIPALPRSADAADTPDGWDASSNAGYMAGPLNVCRWDFRHPYEVPRQTAVEFGFSPYIGFPSGAPSVPLHFAWSELFPDGGKFRGTSRAAQIDTVPSFAPLTGLGQSPAGAFPAFLNMGSYAVNGTTPERATFPPALTFQGNAFRKLERNMGRGSSFLEGFAVSIDQARHDIAVLTNVGAANAPRRVASLASRIGTRARATRGGTSEWWWRPGAPLSLVCPDITPALVHELAEPITLAPGERLTVKLELDPRFVEIADAERTFNAQVGVSFCGYAAIRSK